MLLSTILIKIVLLFAGAKVKAKLADVLGKKIYSRKAKCYNE